MVSSRTLKENVSQFVHQELSLIPKPKPVTHVHTNAYYVKDQKSVPNVKMDSYMKENVSQFVHQELSQTKKPKHAIHATTHA
jgi:hypothetical protein